MAAVAAAQAASAVIGIVGGRMVAKAQARAQIAQAEANVAQSKAAAQAANARTGVAQFMQTLNNNRQMRNAGKVFAAATTNLSRAQGQRQAGNIERSIQQAEQAGAYVANVASKGVAGGSVDTIASTMALRNARFNRAVTDQNAQLDYDAASQIAGIIPNAAAGLDMTVYSTQQDNSVILPPVQAGPNYLGALASSGLLSAGTSFLADKFAGSGTQATGSTGTGLSNPGSGFFSSTGTL